VTGPYAHVDGGVIDLAATRRLTLPAAQHVEPFDQDGITTPPVKPGSPAG
jgi:hypothetical protein